MEYGTGEEICVAIILRDMHIKSYSPECLIFCLNWCITRNSCVPNGLLFPVLYLEICTSAEVENGGKAKVRKVYRGLTENPLREQKGQSEEKNRCLLREFEKQGCSSTLRGISGSISIKQSWGIGCDSRPVQFFTQKSIKKLRFVPAQMCHVWRANTVWEVVSTWHNTTAVIDESPMQLSFLLSYSLRSIDICQKECIRGTINTRLSKLN